MCVAAEQGQTFGGAGMGRQMGRPGVIADDKPGMGDERRQLEKVSGRPSSSSVVPGRLLHKSSSSGPGAVTTEAPS